jgi:hypothetical protein
MRAGGLPLWLSLVVALVTGIVPLCECGPTDGCAGGVVLAGSHGHGHDHGDGEGSGHAACVDSPLTLAAPAPSVTTVAAPAADALTLAVPAVEPPALRPVDARPSRDAGVPPGTQGVVLLR